MSHPVKDAATAILIHGDDLFLVQRHPGLKAFPGYHAFPGGKVDPTDHDAPLEHPAFAQQEPRLIRALARELNEELGFDLFAAVHEGQVEVLQCLGEITTPAWAPLRFRTWFYKIVLSCRPDFDVDPGESSAAEWRSFQDWRHHFGSGRLLLAPPTRLALDALLDNMAIDTLPPFPAHEAEEADIPCLEPVGGLHMLLVRSNTLPPAMHTNAFLLGDADSPRVLIDPSPADEKELSKLFQLLDRQALDLVFLTHHHRDHHQFSTDVARRYGIPMGMSADTQTRIKSILGSEHFTGIEIQTFSEGDILTRWQNEPVRILEIPGHDEGQLAPMPDSRSWCIVGDLIQGVGTVVISPPEGNMSTYFATLRRIIELDPKVVIPSHGMALGTTHYIQMALRHREQREAQVLAGHRAGLSEQALLKQIYPELPGMMQALALVNIRSHMDKLQSEGKIS